MVLETSIVLTGIAEFIDYALFIVGAMAVVYFVLFLFAVRKATEPERKAKDAEWEARAAAGRQWVSKKYTDMKDREKAEETKRTAEREKTNIRNLASPLVNKIVNEVDPLRRNIIIKLNRKERKSGIKDLKELKDKMYSLWKQLRILRHNIAENKKDAVKVIMDQVEALREVVENNCIDKVPSKVDGTWEPEIKKIVDNELNGQIKAGLGNLHDEIRRLHS